MFGASKSQCGGFSHDCLLVYILYCFLYSSLLSLLRFCFPICQHRDAFFRTCVSILFSCQSIHVGSICMPSSTICRICFVVSFCFVKSKTLARPKDENQFAFFHLTTEAIKMKSKAFLLLLLVITTRMACAQ